MEELNEGARRLRRIRLRRTALPDTPPPTTEDGKPDEAAVEQTMSDIYRRLNPERDEFTGRFAGKNDQAPDDGRRTRTGGHSRPVVMVG